MNLRNGFFVFSILSSFSLSAKPQNPQVVSGEASFQTLSENMFQITAGDKAIINWSEFSIKPGEITRFLQPSAQSSVLNRVVNGSISELYGLLESNGQIYLINPAGIIVGAEASINTASFIASTFNCLDSEFLAHGEIAFHGESQALITNYGKIKALDGDISLIGYRIDNQGSLSAPNGSVHLTAGENLLLAADGQVLVRAGSSRLTHENGIRNSGRIEALKAALKADGNIYEYAINHEGTIDALGTAEVNGSIYLVAEHGKVAVNGGLESPGGEIRVLGREIDLQDQADIKTSSDSRGGTILIGGDYKGSNPLIPNASQLFAAPGSSLQANGLKEGDGGKVILWGTDANRFFGSIEAKGGAFSGNGGFVEISSKGHLQPNGKVDTSSPAGAYGTLFLDPCAVTLCDVGSCMDAGYTTMTSMGTTTFDFSGSASAIITTDNTPLTPTGQLTTFLASNNVVIDAGTGTGMTGSITVLDNFSWNPPTTLTLIAKSTPNDFITVNATVHSFAATRPSAQNSFVFDSQTIMIGDGMQTKNAEVLSESGGISITAGSLFSMTSVGGNGAVMNSNGTGASKGSISIQANTVTLQGGGTQSTFIFSQEDVSVVATDLNLYGSPNSVSNSTITISNGLLSVQATNVNIGNLTQQAPAGLQTFATGNIQVAATNLNLVSGTGTAGCQSILFSNQGSVQVALTGDLTISGGSASMGGQGFAAILAAVTAPATGTVSITANNITLDGGTDTTGLNFAAIYAGLAGSGGDGSIYIKATGPNGITMNAGSSGAFIGTFGTATTNDILIDPLTTQLTLNSSATASAAITTGDPSTTGSGAIHIATMGNITLNGTGGNPAQIMANQPLAGSPINDLELIAGQSMLLTNAQIFNGTSGSLILVADNAPPFNTPPFIDSGLFQLSGTLATNGGALQIFSSTPANTTITGMNNLNGATYAPPANTVTGQWFSTFAGGGGVPFTVYFKGASPFVPTPTPSPPPSPLPAIYSSSAFNTRFSPANTQALQNWDIHFSYNLFDFISFNVSYDASYGIEGQTFESAREQYRNYNTLILEQL